MSPKWSLYNNCPSYFFCHTLHIFRVFLRTNRCIFVECSTKFCLKWYSAKDVCVTLSSLRKLSNFTILIWTMWLVVVLQVHCLPQRPVAFYGSQFYFYPWKRHPVWEGGASIRIHLNTWMSYPAQKKKGSGVSYFALFESTLFEWLQKCANGCVQQTLMVMGTILIEGIRMSWVWWSSFLIGPMCGLAVLNASSK